MTHRGMTTSWPRIGVWLGGLGLFVSGPLVILGGFVMIEFGCDRVHAIGGLLCALLSAGLCLAGLDRCWTRVEWLLANLLTAALSFWLSVSSIQIC